MPEHPGPVEERSCTNNAKKQSPYLLFTSKIVHPADGITLSQKYPLMPLSLRRSTYLRSTCVVLASILTGNDVLPLYMT